MMYYTKIILILISITILLVDPIFCNDYIKKFNLLDNSDLKNLNSKNIIWSYEIIRPKVGVAFSGGGARGFAQFGALKALVEEGIPIDYVVGTSIGSVVAGLYAVGYSPDQMDSIIKNTNWEETITFNDNQNRSDLFLDQKLIQDRSLLTLRFQNFEFVMPEAISLGTKFTSFLQKLIWNGLYHADGDFNSLKIPFKAIATDLISGKTVTLNSGNLVTAIRASSSFPLRYTPIRVDSMVLVDGGLMSNIPIKNLIEFNPDFTIAINTISPLLESEYLNKPWNIADQVVSLLMKQFSDKDSNSADFTISPDLGNHGYTEFNNLESIVKTAYLDTKKLIPLIKQKYNSLTDSLFLAKLQILHDTYKNIILKGFDEEDLSILDTQMFNQFSYEEKVGKLLTTYNSNKYYCLLFNTYDENTSLEIEVKKYPVITSVKINTTTKHYGQYDSLSISVNKLFSGQLLNNHNIEKLRELILKSLRNSGLSFADIINIKFDKVSSELSLDMVEGLINSIKILGLVDNDYLVKRELKFSEGDFLNSKIILESWENILSIDFISEAEIILSNVNEKGMIDVIIKTRSIGDQSILIGARTDNERYTRIGLDLIKDNTFNLGTRLSIRFMGGLRDRFFGFKAENTRIFNTFFTNSYGVYYDNNEKHKYFKKPVTNRNRFEYSTNTDNVEERFGAKLSLGMQMEKKGTLFSEIRFENQRFWEITKEPAEFRKLLSLKISSIFDNEDKSEFPTEGSLLDMSLESTLLNDKDAINFSKVKFLYRVNYKLGATVIKPLIYFGFADATTPLPEFFSLGGQDMFFGMREDEQRGRQVALASLDARIKSPYTLFFDTYLSFRYDLGSAWENFETIKFSGLRHGIGSMITFDTPLGPAKFSLGRSFSFLKNPNAVAWGEVIGYFSIGMRL